ncbi:DciA family protein [uncultured Microscilla sp.]|uniref:DciA family protein n=1 Tax=uncultured Microscilla sp. TaxID=432653 RepID=UPI002638517D|nr:DciA family protein [uncultured Microscilla sp.]
MKIYNDTMNIKQAVAAMLQILPKQAKQKLNTEGLKGSWVSIVGEFAAKRTVKLDIKNSTLFLKFDSPALRENLSYRKTEILEKVQSVDKDVKRIFWY